jgi:cytochrome c biogenesis protein ResB
MATAAALPARPTRREDLVERIWELATSPRLAAGLALALAAGWAAALLLAPAEATSAGAAGSGSALTALLELDDPLHSWWFTLLLVMLALCVLAFSVDRLPRAASAVWRPSRRLTPPVERGLRHRRRLESGADAGAEAGRVAAAFRARGFEPETAEEGGTWYLFAQRGRHARLGEWVALAGLLGLLGVGIAGRLLEWDGTMEVQEGTTADDVSRRAAGGLSARQRLPFAVRVNRLEADRGPTGAPATFRADVSLLGPGGREIRRQDLDQAHPLRQGGIDLDLGAWRELPGGARVSLVLVDEQERVRRPVRAGRGEPFQAGPVAFSVEDYSPAYRELGPAVRIRRTEDGRSTEFWVFQNRPDFDAQNRPDRWGLEFEGLQKSYAATLRAAYRPVTEGLVAGAALLLLGLVVAFSAAHRRLWARVEPGAIVLAGASHRSSPGLERTLDEIRRDLVAPAARA